jgi:hypothetical protein
MEQFVRKALSDAGNSEAIAVLDNLDSIRRSPHISRCVRPHITHGTEPIRVYPLAKFVIGLDILTSQSIPVHDRESLRQELLSRVLDPIYRERFSAAQIK